MINELILAGALFFHPPVLQDSIGTETINGKVFVIHQVGEKETLYAISKRYGTSIDAILQYNPTADAGLEVGQIIKVPYIPRKTIKPEGNVHVVAAKETMFSISKSYDVSIDDIKKWNNLTSNSLSVGQEIIIKKGSPTKPPQAAVAPSTSPAVSSKGMHVVAAKETMFSIARQYGITVQQLKDWNSMEVNDISIGQELYVSSPKVDVSKPVVSTPSPEVKKQEPAVVSEIKKETPVAAEIKKDPSPAPAEVKEQTIRISESVKNSDEVLQNGLAELIEGTEGNRKYLALHRTAPVGTILKVKNEMNNREVFVRVMGKLPDTALSDKLVIKISRSAYDRLGAIDSRFRVEVTYYK
ncbi:MAG: LysM peptidoglycan-binding domain-containing protein [Chryseolinea sp.]